MKTWKMVSGILSIILFVFVTFQSCAVGIANTLESSSEVSGSAGVIVAVMLLAGGIVSICTRKGGKGGDIALIILYGIGALFGFVLFGSFSDLVIWAFWCLICAALAVISLVKGSTKAMRSNNFNNRQIAQTPANNDVFSPQMTQMTQPPVMPQKNFCHNCGSPIVPGKNFCGNCGTPYDQPIKETTNK